MPAPWKKQKANRISRLVADIQSPPKRGGSLVVETGFPTSIVDLFVKNRDRLKKPTKKKHLSKQPTVITEETVKDQALSVEPSPVSDPHVSVSSSDEPNSSIDGINQETIDQNDIFDSSVEEIVAEKDYLVKLIRGYCNDEDEEDEGENNGGVLKCKKAICLMILKGSLVVGVAVYTKRFIGGITLGAFLMLLLEYVGNLIIQYFRPCKADGSKGGKEGENEAVSNRAIEEEGGNSLVLKWETRNETVSRRFFQQEDGSGIASKGEIEQENVQTFLIKDSTRIDDEMWGKIVHTIEALEPNVCASRNSFYGPGGLCELQSITWPIAEGEEGDIEGPKILNRNVKTKKGKKFWKKFAIKHKKNKHKHDKEEQQEGDGCEMPKDCPEDSTAELGDDDEEEGDEPGNFDSLFVEELGMSNHRSACESYTQVTCEMLRNGGDNSKFLIMMMLALAGLIKGRIFSLMLTMICCFMFKLMRSLRAGSISKNTE